jgi:hypothetical protein
LDGNGIGFKTPERSLLLELGLELGQNWDFKLRKSKISEIQILDRNSNWKLKLGALQ